MCAICWRQVVATRGITYGVSCMVSCAKEPYKRDIYSAKRPIIHVVLTRDTNHTHYNEMCVIYNEVCVICNEMCVVYNEMCVINNEMCVIATRLVHVLHDSCVVSHSRAVACVCVCVCMRVCVCVRERVCVCVCV